MTVKDTRLKRVVSLRAGGTPPVSEPRFWAQSGEGTPWVSIADMSDGSVVFATQRALTDDGVRDRGLEVAPEGTLLFAMYASVGAVAELGVPATWNQALLGLCARPGLADLRFVRYWLVHLRPSLAGLVRSNTQDNLNAEQVGNFPFPVISAESQRAIADFLDAETARIDALITKKRRMKELSEEHHRAEAHVVLQADTKVALRRLADVLPGYMFLSEDFGPDLDGPRLLRGINVGVGGVRWDDRVRLRPDSSVPGRYTLREGDVVIGMDRPFIAGGTRVARIDEESSGSLLVQRVCRIRAASIAQAVVIEHALSSSQFVAHVEPDLTGVSVPHLSDEQIGSMPIPAFDRGQAEAASARLLEAHSRKAKLTRRLQRQVELLQERRQALITAAVTGELQVPGAAA